MKAHFDFPQALLKNLPDAEVEVISWSAQSQELVLKVVKDVTTERGVLRFVGVSHVILAPRFTINGIGVAATLAEPGSSDVQEFAFEIQAAWGETYRVVADSLTYTVPA